jgi:predicted DsbA family dithiol-disulfide isomerase
MVIDVYADLACPWCYIGERRLAAALAARPALRALPRWRPFQLQPALPAGGVPWRTFAETKFGGWDRARELFAQVTAAGAGDGIRFDFEHLPKAVNTADAHRLILSASGDGRGLELARRLFAAYFEEMQDIGDPDVLAALAGEVGLDPDESARVLASGAFRAEVVASQGEARRAGISGVPHVVFDQTYAVTGAQPTAVLVKMLDRLAALDQ